ncbi:MAG: 4Fe-4S dicluster domain-containing protein [Candidatus Lokiarchaeota archaeon]|nr:4Fe-4S dicluster domain-containing protein [Candidatus Lokiarchaeota archaeon]
MPIVEIDYEKCTFCGTCIRVCPRRLFNEINGEKVEYGDPKSMCIRCGHCVARCPEDAIIYEDMGESYEFSDVNHPERILSYENLFKFLQAHRSIRRYKKEKVSEELLQKVFKAMQWAPTGRNMRSESFIIISDEEQLKTLSDAIQKTLTEDKSWGWLYGERLANLAKEFRSPVYFDAPHLIIVYSQLFTDIGIQNIANIITYGRLAAHSLGLGTCWNGWTQAAIEIDPKIMKLAGFRAKKLGAFTIGYPDVTFYRTPPRSFKHVKGLT